jgi:hypothetical protein
VIGGKLIGQSELQAMLQKTAAIAGNR